jgi:hypothetical protein
MPATPVVMYWLFCRSPFRKYIQIGEAVLDIETGSVATAARRH